MTSIAKPAVSPPRPAANKLGLTVRDYEGAMSTLCAGCGHDSVTAAHRAGVLRARHAAAHGREDVAASAARRRRRRTSSSGAHGFNSVHGRMPSIATGANAANRELTYIGVSGDGDSLSIGLGQLCHAIRRNVEHAVRASRTTACTASPRASSRRRRTSARRRSAARPTSSPRSIPCCWRSTLGATFVARSFSGDKAQLVPILKAGLSHNGFALVDVISPCVTFNDHEGSTKSYLHTREHLLKVVQADFVPPAQEITAQYDEGTTITRDDARRQHGAPPQVSPDYDPTRPRSARPQHAASSTASAARSRPACCSSRSAPPTCTTSTARPRCRCRSSRSRSSARARPSSTSCRKPSADLPSPACGRGPGEGKPLESPSPACA